MIPQLLTPTLAFTLARLFRLVVVVDPGELRKTMLGMQGDIPIIRVLRAGERYFVTCPFCKDSGRSLQIQHGYIIHYRAWAWRCHASGCETQQANVDRLDELVTRAAAACYAGHRSERAESAHVNAKQEAQDVG